MDKFNWFNLPSIAGNRRNEQSYWNRCRYWTDSTNRLDSLSSDVGFGVPFRGGILTAFFIKPKLKIVYNLRAPVEHVHQHLDSRWHPKFERLQSGFSEPHFPMRRFIDIIVVNHGKTVARNCEVKAQRSSSPGIGCQTLGTDLKSLAWDNGETKMNIPAKSGRAKFHLVFSQGNFTKEQLHTMTPQLCKETPEKMQLHTCRDKDGT